MDQSGSHRATSEPLTAGVTSVSFVTCVTRPGAGTGPTRRGRPGTLARTLPDEKDAPLPRRKSRRAPAPDQVDDRPTVVVCRGGDCGNRTKHPGVDHVGQLRTVVDGLPDPTARVVTSKCLDACEHSNVVVVVPGAEGRAAGGAPTWVGEVLDEETTAQLVAWVAAGGPALAPEPVLVDLRSFRPSRLNRHELEEETGLS